jgi:two-component system nitrogen regulation sensor histidine kinase NtrY
MSAGMGRSRHKLNYETRLTLLALLGGLPAIALAFFLLWLSDYGGKVMWTAAVLILSVWLGCTFALRERLVRPLQTLSNLLAALREEDYSIRARSTKSDDILADVFLEANALGKCSGSSVSGLLKPRRSCAPSWPRSMWLCSPLTAHNAFVW